MSDAIDAYLDALMLRLLDDPSRNEVDVAAIRRAVAESEDHLRETQRAAMANGSGDADAAQLAVDRFGSVNEVAGRFRQSGTRRHDVTFGAVFRSLWLMGGIGLIAIGMSGVVASILGAVWGHGFVAADLPGVTYTPQRCAQYAELAPGHATCEQAAIAHHFGEVVQYRMAAGMLGLLVLVAYSAWIFLARRTGRSTSLIPPTWFEAVGAAIFGVAAAAALLVSVGHELTGPAAGTGQYLSAGLVSLVVASGFAIALARSVTRVGGWD
jgi:hypothetical protein